MKSEAKKSSVTSGQGTESILINKTRVFLNHETQTSKSNRPFRLSGSRMHTTIPAKWIDGVLNHHFIHTFRYLDKQDGFFEVEVDYENKFVSLTKL